MYIDHEHRIIVSPPLGRDEPEARARWKGKLTIPELPNSAKKVEPWPVVVPVDMSNPDPYKRITGPDHAPKVGWGVRVVWPLVWALGSGYGVYGSGRGI